MEVKRDLREPEASKGAEKRKAATEGAGKRSGVMTLLFFLFIILRVPRNRKNVVGAFCKFARFIAYSAVDVVVVVVVVSATQLRLQQEIHIHTRTHTRVHMSVAVCVCICIYFLHANTSDILNAASEAIGPAK